MAVAEPLPASRTAAPPQRSPKPQASERVDVLLLQLGTPRAPTAAGLRPYLREFLTDGRVLELPAVGRWLLVNGVIVPFRSFASAKKYRRIWDETTGSPLLSITKAQTEKLQQALGDHYNVRFGMRYGEPSIKRMVRDLMQAGCRRLVVVPMYPQYSATTTASGIDGLFKAMMRERIVPAMRVIDAYHLDPKYLDAVEQSVRRVQADVRAAGFEPEMNIVSFHGIPIDYIKRGDPYMRQAAETGKALAKRMGWKKGDWRLTFQSRLGRQKWLTPYFDKTLEELGHAGVKSVLVVQPGFTADCLETIDEIGHEGTEEFKAAGGEHLFRVPCLNDDAAFIEALKSLVEREAHGWHK